MPAERRDGDGRREFPGERDSLLELAHDAIIVREPFTSAVTYWNSQASEIYGYSAAEAQGQITHVLLATEFPVAKEIVDAQLLTAGRWEGELIHRRADGRQLIVASRQALIRDDRGEPTAIIELNADITERKHAEAELDRAEERFRGLIEAAPDAIVITDDEGRIVLVNARTEQLFGYSREELIEQPVAMILPRGLSPSWSGRREKYQGAPSANPPGLATDAVAVRKDGLKFTVELAVSHVRTESGSWTSASIRDVSLQLLRQLETSLVPRLKISSRWQVAWRYRPAVQTMLLAGDFIGAAERSDGSLALLIGDVTGHGPAAAGTGATLRAAWLGATQSEIPIESIPSMLHRLLVNSAEPTFATICLAEIDPSGREMRLVRAGHDCPLLITPDAATPLETAHGPMLGFNEPSHWPVEVVALPDDAAIMLYTDGLTEYRSPGGSDREYHELAQRIDPRAILERAPDAALDQLLATLYPAAAGELEDDIAVILLNLSRERDR